MTNIQYPISNKKIPKRHLTFAIRHLKFDIPRESGAGFTLIELLLTIAIMSILMVLVMTAINPFEQIKKANDGRRKSDLSELQKALEIYYQDNGSYPNATSDKKIDDNGVPKAWGDTWSPYMAILPRDPSEPTLHYAYGVGPENQDYVLYASLERQGKDPQACNSSGDVCPNAVSATYGLTATACGGICNFGVSSSNATP